MIQCQLSVRTFIFFFVNRLTLEVEGIWYSSGELELLALTKASADEEGRSSVFSIYSVLLLWCLISLLVSGTLVRASKLLNSDKFHAIPLPCYSLMGLVAVVYLFSFCKFGCILGWYIKKFFNISLENSLFPVTTVQFCDPWCFAVTDSCCGGFSLSFRLVNSWNWYSYSQPYGKNCFSCCSKPFFHLFLLFLIMEM